MDRSVEKSCPRCGVVFITTGSSRYRKIYCSRDCFTKTNSAKPIVKAKARERASRRYAEKRDEVMAASIRYRERNREKLSKLTREWQKQNPSKYMLIKTERIAKMKKAFCRWADREKIAEIYAQAKKLTLETGILHHVDHIIPMKGKNVTGLHHEDNLQILTASQNLRKYNNVTI